MQEGITISNDIAGTSERMMAGTGAMLLAGGLTVTALFEPTSAGFFPVCILYTTTGIACPGCGLTRGFHALFHGDLVTALDFNLLIPVWAVIFAYVIVSLVLTVIRGRGLPMWPTNTRFMYGFMIVLFVFGVLRNIPLYPLTFLYP